MIKIFKKLFKKKEPLFKNTELTGKGKYLMSLHNSYPELDIYELEELYCKTFGVDYESIRIKREQEKTEDYNRNKIRQEQWLNKHKNARIVKAKIIKSTGEYSWTKEEIGKIYEIYNIPVEEEGYDEKVYRLANNIEMWGYLLRESDVELCD